MKRDHIEISLYQITTIVLYNTFLGKIDPVQRTALVVNLGLRRVEVFGTFLIVGHNPATESNDLTGQITNREHHPGTETIEQSAFRFYGQSRFYQKLFFISFF